MSYSHVDALPGNRSAVSGRGGPRRPAFLAGLLGLLGLLFCLAPAQAAGLIRSVAGDGVWGYAGDGGPPLGAQFKTPAGLALDAQGNFYVADVYNHRIRKFTLDGSIVTVAGSGVTGSSGDGGPAVQARLDSPTAVAADAAGNLYIADSWNHKIRKVGPGGAISTLALGAFVLNYPTGVAVDGGGNLYIADHNNYRILKQDSAGTVTIVAGNGSPLFGGDGGPATSAGINPTGVAVDGGGNLYIADTGNHRIRMVNTAGVISTVAGDGTEGYGGDGGPSTAARLGAPTDVAVDAGGVLYIADRTNHRIRKVDRNGIISTVAGDGVAGYSGDGGPATAAHLSYPYGIVVDAGGGVVYFSDSNNYRIRAAETDGGGGGPATSRVLSVNRTGTGSGGVQAPAGLGGGINCGLVCAESYVISASVTLTAQAGADSVFTGWAGACSGTDPTASVSMTTDKTCIANFDLANGASHTLIVNPPSGGKIVSTPAGIDCGTTCSAPFAHNSDVTLSALPEVGFRFVQWGGACSGVSVSTTVSMGAAKVCSASFAPLTEGSKTLTVTRTGNGTVTSQPTGIECGSTCTAAYPQNTEVALVATPGPDSRFTGWSGECGGTQNTTSVLLDAAKTCTAGFELLAPGSGVVLSVNNVGDGTITSEPVGINCGNTCATQFVAGTSLTLIATPGPNQVFVGWSSDCAGTNATLSLTLEQGMTCTANYEPLPAGAQYALIAGVSGNGTVSSADNQIDCGAQCTALYAAGTTQTLKAVPAAGSRLANWSGDCSGGNLSVSVNMNGSKVCTANFVPEATGGMIISTVAGLPQSAGYSGDGGRATAAKLSANLPGLAFDVAGNLYIADAGNNVVRQVSADGVIATFAGDGSPALVPGNVAQDRNGNLYVADPAHHVVRKVAAGGTLGIVAGTLDSSGFTGNDGSATAAKLNAPAGVALDALGTLYIADTGNHCVRKVSPGGTISAAAGNCLDPVPGYSGDGGSAVVAKLNAPRAVALDNAGRLYIADTGNHRIRVVVGGTISTLAGNGGTGATGDGGPATGAEIGTPEDLTLDSTGKLYIADSANHVIRTLDAFATSGTTAIDTLAGTLSAGFSPDGTSVDSAQLNKPTALAADSADNLYVADSGNNVVRRIGYPLPSVSLSLAKTGAGTGNVSGGGLNCGSTCGGSYDPNLSVTLTATPDAGSVFTGWGGNCSGSAVSIDVTLSVSKTCIANFEPASATQTGGIITTFAGTGVAGYGGDQGPALAAQISQPWGVAAVQDMNCAVSPCAPGSGTVVFIADRGNHVVRKVDNAGTISTLAGNHTQGYSGDGGPSTLAQLNSPAAVAVGPNGKLYIADTHNHRIRMLDAFATATTVDIQTVAGSGTLGFSGDAGPASAAQLSYPAGVAVDSQGEIYIADTSNQRVRKVTSDGNIITVAGTGTAGFAGDGDSALKANFSFPTGLALDKDGNLYIADRSNHRVRKLDRATGLIQTVAGNGSEGLGGDGGPAVQAQLSQPFALALDALGNLYIAEAGGHGIRKVDGNGIISTVAGRHIAGYSGDGGPAREAQINTPQGVAVDQTGALYIGDTLNHRVRKVGGSTTTQYHILNVAKTGTGSGTVTSAPAGLANGVNCGGTCSETYTHNALVTLVATPGAGASFAGWSGACSGTNPTTTLFMGADKTCVAAFSDGSGGVGVLGFALNEYSVAENAGTFALKVSRTGDSAGAVSVDYVFQESSALLGQDYSASNGTLYWGAGDMGEKAIPMLIIDNPVINEHRRFGVRLQSPSGGASLGIDTAVLTIINDDLLPDGVRCPSSGVIDTVCNAMGTTLNDLSVTPNGHVSNGTLEGTLLNGGWVSNLIVGTQGALSGGIVTGLITNYGIMVDFEFHGTTLSGGTLGGTIKIVTGTLRDVRLAPNTVLDGGLLGGKLGGAITGDAAGPGLVQNLTVTAGTHLSNVLIGTQVVFENGVIFGPGTRFPQGAALPAGAQIETMLAALPPRQCGTAPVAQPASYDLQQDVYYPSAGILAAINDIPALRLNNFVLTQDTQYGYLQLLLGDKRYLVQPYGVGLAQAPFAADVVVDDLQNVLFTTANGTGVRAPPALAEACALQAILAGYEMPELSIQANGNLRISSPDSQVWYSVRPDFVAVTAPLTVPTGLYSGIGPQGLPVAYYIFADANGRKHQQLLYPAAVDPEALRRLVPGLTYDGGVINVWIGGQLYRGVLEYTVTRGAATGNMDVAAIPDANGDGLGDYLLFYPDGNRQVLYRLP